MLDLRRDVRINTHSISGRGKEFFGVETEEPGGRRGLQRTDDPEGSEGRGNQEGKGGSEGTDAGNLEARVNAVQGGGLATSGRDPPQRAGGGSARRGENLVSFSRSGGGMERGLEDETTS